MKEQTVNKHDIDAMDQEDYDYYSGKTRDLSSARWKTAEEIPWIKAYQEKKGIRKPDVPSKSVRMKIDGDILAWLKEGGRGYQARANAILRKAMQDSFAH